MLSFSVRHIFLGLPAYNEEPSIEPLYNEIEAASTLLRSEGVNLRVILFNDGSTDGTSKESEKWSKSLGLEVRKIDSEKNRGLDVAVFEIMKEFLRLASPEDSLVLMDCDNTHQPIQIVEFLQSSIGGNDIVVASRYVSGASIQGLSKTRKFLSMAASYYFSLLFPNSGTSDFTCGFRLYTHSAVSQIKESVGEKFQYSGFSCMPEILILGSKLGLKISSIPLRLRYDRKESASKMKVLKNVWQLLKLGVLMRFSKKDSFRI